MQDRVVHLWLDGERWDSLPYGKTRSRDIAPGRHVVKAHNTLFGTTIEFDADDPAELIALAEEIAAHENCKAVCTVLPNRPHLLLVRFERHISIQCQGADPTAG